MTVILSILTATTPTGATDWARLFSYQLPTGHDPGLETALEIMTRDQRTPGHTYRWTNYRVPVELVPTSLLDTEHNAEIQHGRILSFHGVDLMPVLADHEAAQAVLIEPGKPIASSEAAFPAT